MRTLSLSWILVSAVAFAQATVVTKDGTGEAAVVKKDEARAFEDAKNAALRSAVEQAAGVRIDADSLAVNNQLVRDQVFANTSGYVKSFDVVSKKVDKGVMTVVVKANIITENLDKDIQAARDLVKRSGRPTVIVLLNEQTLVESEVAKTNAVMTTKNLEVALSNAMQAEGWDVRNESVANMGKLTIAAGVSLSGGQARELAEVAKVQYVVSGSVTMRHMSPDLMMMGGRTTDGKQTVFPVSGEYELTVFATDTGALIKRFTGRLFKKGTSELDTKALSAFAVSYERSTFNVIDDRKADIIGEVRRAVVEHLRNRAVNGVEVSMTVKGLESFGAVKDFRQALEAMKGVRSIDEGDLVKGVASYRVTFAGVTSELAEQIESATFKKRKLEVQGKTSSTLEVLVSK
ncbi:MAG: flagellar assembly protein T N-terminal domain-containing protein [Myxococcales bacterium]|nr:flagellar assembly protein T N-terminal domain-containing protein [Myxococcales bacterium]